jgi:uncharacterized alpha-E superfamily protein
MLSRTADHLFWMSRYTERAENTARMLDVNYQMSLMPQSDKAVEASWRALLDLFELTNDYLSHHDVITPSLVMAYMVQSTKNPSSIICCLQSARENARAVRGTMTTDLWESINTTWLEAQKKIKQGTLNVAPTDFFEWVKFRSHQSRGVHIGTMLRDEVYYFIGLGLYLERADNMARLLDVKFVAANEYEGDLLTDVDEFYYWAAILRSASAFENYRKVYRDAIKPKRVAELMILSLSNPRSLVSSVSNVVSVLNRIKNAQSGAIEHDAHSLLSQLRDLTIDEIFEQGIHEFLTDYLYRINRLSGSISQHFLLPLVEVDEK